jgi:carboxyl-terminal processing protease
LAADPGESEEPTSRGFGGWEENTPGLSSRPPAGPRRWIRRLVAAVLVMAAMLLSFYGGVLAQFHYGPTIDNQVPAALLLTHRTKGLDFATLQQIYDVMQQKYAKAEINPDDAFNGAAKGMVQIYLNGKFGDAFSNYYTPDELKDNQDFLQGSFGGIGATMSAQNGKLTIIKLISGTPSDSAGLKPGDVVTKIDGTSTDGMTLTTAVNKIKGPVGTHVKLTVQRDNKSYEFDIVRANISVPSVRSKDIAPGILYVKINEFGANTAQDFESALRQGLSRGDNKIILDLRQNPGGYVSAADSVVSEFVESGASVTVVGRNNSREEHRVSGKGIAFSPKLVVLVDGNTASAAEITSGALEDNHRATLVGQKTFGKGLVEEDYPLRNGGALHLTIAYWYRPNGQSIDKNGITPDQVVALDKPENLWDVDMATSDPAKDAQLQTALNDLK